MIYVLLLSKQLCTEWMQLAECHQVGARELHRIPMKPSRPGQNGTGDFSYCLFSLVRVRKRQRILKGTRTVILRSREMPKTPAPGSPANSACLFLLLHLLSSGTSQETNQMVSKLDSGEEGSFLCAEAEHAGTSEPRACVAAEQSMRGQGIHWGRTGAPLCPGSCSNPQCLLELAQLPCLPFQASPFFSLVYAWVCKFPEAMSHSYSSLYHPPTPTPATGPPAQPHVLHRVGTQCLLNE